MPTIKRKRHMSSTWKPSFSLSTLLRRKKKEPSDAADGQRQPERSPRNWDPPTKLSDKPLPDGWELHLDPFGQPYFYKESWKLATRNNVREPDELRDLTLEYEARVSLQKDYLATLDDYLISLSSVFAYPGSDEEYVYYYVVDYSRYTTEANRVVGGGENLYETLLEYPIHSLPRSLEETMLAALIYHATELIMGAERSTSQYTLDQCLRKISLYKTLRNETSEKSAFPTAISIRRWFMAHEMSEIHISRCHYHHGEVGATTTIQSSLIAAPSWILRLLDICLLVLCFRSHKIYRERLRRTQTTDGLLTRIFMEFLEETLQEWSDIKLLGSVFVLANMAFLSVSQSLLTKTQETLIFISTVFSLANLIGGMYMIWKHQHKGQVLSDEQFHYVHQITGHSKLNISYTSVLLCLPLVFLLWSIVTLAAAILHVSIQTFKSVSMRYLPLLASMVIFIVFCVFLYQLWRTSNSASVVLRIWRTLHGQRATRGDIEMDKIEGEDRS